MPLVRYDPDQVWEGPNKIYADRLIVFCLSTQVDPQVEIFTRAVGILAHLDSCVRTYTVTSVENRVERDATLAAAALRLAELVL